MKQLIIYSCVSLLSLNLLAQTSSQNKPGTTILNSTSNNSMSGVNPNGNPGTIIYNSSNSGALNNTLITPNTPVTTTIVSTPNNSTVVSTQPVAISSSNENNVVVSTTAVNPNVTSNTAVTTKIDEPAQTATAARTTSDKNLNSTTTVVKVTGNTNTGLKPLTTSPVLVNYIPEIIVTKLKETYADKLYDITMMKQSDNRLLYIVRVKEGSGYITYYLDKDGSLVK